MKWTANNVDVLKSRLKRGWKVDEIATSFKITPNAVAKKAQSLGISVKGGVPLKRKKTTKSKTRAGRMTGNPDYAPQVMNPSTDVPAPTDPSKPTPEPESEADKPSGRVVHEGDRAFWRS